MSLPYNTCNFYLYKNIMGKDCYCAIGYQLWDSGISNEILDKNNISKSDISPEFDRRVKEIIILHDSLISDEMEQAYKLAVALRKELPEEWDKFVSQFKEKASA